jgi:hypothetical protein
VPGAPDLKQVTKSGAPRLASETWVYRDPQFIPTLTSSPASPSPPHTAH